MSIAVRSVRWPSQSRRRAIIIRAVPLLRDSASGRTVQLEGSVTVGKAKECSIQLDGANIAPQHATIRAAGGRVYCKADAGDPGDFMADTFTWMLPDVQLRGGVDYLVAPGTEFSFGELGQNVWKVEFEEGGDSAMADMLMKGMASGASKEVQDLLKERS